MALKKLNCVKVSYTNLACSRCELLLLVTKIIFAASVETTLNPEVLIAKSISFIRSRGFLKHKSCFRVGRLQTNKQTNKQGIPGEYKKHGPGFFLRDTYFNCVFNK